MPANYKKLVLWQKSMQLAVLVYKICDDLPNSEKYALVDQMRRAAISVPSNIAEGNGRGSDRDYAKFLFIARGSLSELQTQLDLCVMLNYLASAQLQELMILTVEISKMLNSLIKKLLKSAQTEQKV